MGSCIYNFSQSTEKYVYHEEMLNVRDKTRVHGFEVRTKKAKIGETEREREKKEIVNDDKSSSPFFYCFVTRLRRRAL